MLRSECLLLLDINFVNSGKECKKAIIFLMSLLNCIEEEKFDKNNETLKYLNNISGNLLQIFEGKDITSNLETDVKFFMSETVCHFFFFFMREEIKYFPKQTYISLDCWNIFVRNNVNANGCYMCICFILHLAKLIATPLSF